MARVFYSGGKKLKRKPSWAKKGKRSFKKRSFKKGRGKKIARKPVSAGTGGFTVETIAVGDIGTNSGAPYSFNFHISDFPRATALQSQFRYYRCTKVEWTYEALWNVYTAQHTTGTAIAATVPQAYWKMDREQLIPFLSVADFQDAGCKPRPLTKKMTIKYVPNQVYTVAPTTELTPTPPGQMLLKRKPNTWINTVAQASTPGYIEDNSYYVGHQLILDQLASSGATNPALARVVVTAHWQFKDPFIAANVAPSLGGLVRTQVMDLKT